MHCVTYFAFVAQVVDTTEPGPVGAAVVQEGYNTSGLGRSALTAEVHGPVPILKVKLERKFYAPTLAVKPQSRRALELEQSIFAIRRVNTWCP